MVLANWYSYRLVCPFKNIWVVRAYDFVVGEDFSRVRSGFTIPTTHLLLQPIGTSRWMPSQLCAHARGRSVAIGGFDVRNRVARRSYDAWDMARGAKDFPNSP